MLAARTPNAVVRGTKLDAPSVSHLVVPAAHGVTKPPSHPQHASVCAPVATACTGRRNVLARFQTPSQTGFDPIRSTDEAVVEEIMQPRPITLRPDMTCHEAARVFLNNDITSAPVVDGSGRLLGVLSEGDLLWKSSGPLDHTIIPPVFVGAFDLLISLRDDVAVRNELDKILAHTVGEAMTRSPAVTSTTTKLSLAARTLLQAKVHLLPVVDEQNKVVGVLTQHDILRGMVAEQDL